MVVRPHTTSSELMELRPWRPVKTLALGPDMAQPLDSEEAGEVPHGCPSLRNAEVAREAPPPRGTHTHTHTQVALWCGHGPRTCGETGVWGRPGDHWEPRSERRIAPFVAMPLLLVAFLLLVVWPGAPIVASYTWRLQNMCGSVKM